MSKLQGLAPTTQRFKFMLQPQEALDLLTEKYCEEVVRRNRVFEVDEYSTSTLIRIAEALTAERPKLGIWLYGMPGNGKTSLMRAFVRAVERMASARKFDYMGEYFRPKPVLVKATYIANLCKEKPQEFANLQRESILCIDDIGTEPVEVQDFGNVKLPIVEVLLTRYDTQQFTMVTTNIAPDKIADTYGLRVADRCREMFVPVKFNGPTYRRQ